MSEMEWANVREEERHLRDRFASTLAICASIIATDENIRLSSPGFQPSLTCSVPG